MKTVLLGAGGQIGREFQRQMDSGNLFAYDHAALDICDHPNVKSTLKDLKPDVVINAAAYTDVDACEHEVERAFRVNAFAVHNLAKACSDVGCVLIHFSTDYVFGGEKRMPYREDDLPSPRNVYGASKLAGEHLLRSALSQHILIRTSGLYGPPLRSGQNENFVETMISLAQKKGRVQVVDDQILSPTYTRDVVRAAISMLDMKAYGLFHITNRGQSSWFAFARAIFEGTGLNPELERIPSSRLNREAARPPYSVLSNQKWNSLGGERLPPWEEALARYLDDRAQAMN